MLSLANIALGIVISATPVAAQGRHEAGAQAQKEKPGNNGAENRAPAPPANPRQNQPESGRPAIGPRTTQGLAEDAIIRNSPNR